MFFLAQVALGTNHFVQMDEVGAGANGDSRIQFVEVKFPDGQNRWSAQPGDGTTNSRAILVFFDSTGAETSRFEFDHDPPATVANDPNTPGLFSALIATQELVDAIPGITFADFIIPPSVIAQAGKVCFTGNPLNPNAFDVNLCLSYGDNVSPDPSVGRVPYIGSTDGAGPPGAALPITGALAMQRFQDFGCVGEFPPCHENADFQLAAPAPRNTSGETGSIAVASQIAQGRVLFEVETFLGNSRTCATCHVDTDGLLNPPLHGGLTPAFVQDLHLVNPTDPLFIAENTGDPFALDDLENPCLMVLGNGGAAGGNRALILENIDGLPPTRPVFRESVHILNVKFTDPFGHNNDVPNLRDFSRGAVNQHFPKDMNRNHDPNNGPLAARIPTEAEVVAMEAFMNDVQLPSNLDEILAAGQDPIAIMIQSAVDCRGADPVQVERGRALFFSEVGQANCNSCHNTVVLSGKAKDTGVVDLAVNDDDGCSGGPGDPTLPLPLDANLNGSRRKFGTPPMFGISQTAPFFHANEINNLHDAVEFYNSLEFANSDDAVPIAMTPQDIDDIVAFLDTLVEPTGCDGACCLPGGNCIQGVTQAECEAQCGTFRGSGTVCAGQLCPTAIPGACCLPDGSCTQTSGACLCSLAGGTFQGPGTNCGSVACPQPGACCLPNGTCEDMMSTECDAQCGSFEGANTSCQNLESCCHDLARACCHQDGSCTNTTKCLCDQAGGTPGDIGSNCATTDCPAPGACCLPTGCIVVFQEECLAQCGIFLGEGTVCGALCIQELPRPCCLPSGACTLTSTCLCQQQGGTVQPGFTCNGVQCIQPPGACCLENGTCQIVTAAQCTALCGTFRGPNSACTPACPIVAKRRCCLPGGLCRLLTPCVCAAQGGASGPPGSVCGPFNLCAIQEEDPVEENQ